MSYTLQDIYKEYAQIDSSIDKKIFRDICEEFNIEIINKILSGKNFE